MGFAGRLLWQYITNTRRISLPTTFTKTACFIVGDRIDDRIYCIYIYSIYIYYLISYLHTFIASYYIGMEVDCEDQKKASEGQGRMNGLGINTCIA